MLAAWYEKKGSARDTLVVSDLPDPEPGPGEVRVRIAASAVNPTDTKARAGRKGSMAMQFPRVIPHQDGAGTIDRVGRGVPEEKITTVHNATDTAELRRLLQEISDEEALSAKECMTGSRSSKIGLYCGMMGPIKALPLLLDAARRVKQRCPEFHLVLVGSGPDRAWLEASISSEPWIHYLGSRYGRESALYYKMADIFLLAGTAGLSIVDSFAAGLPLLATRLSTHPPEISYIIDGENGLLSLHNAEEFSLSILSVLSNSALMQRLRRGAEKSGYCYTMEAMIANFKGGVEECLALNGKFSSAAKRNLLSPESEG